MGKAVIGIIGYGMVGGTLGRWFERAGHTIIPFDPPKGIGSKDELDQADTIFICVPTPFDEQTQRFDGRLVEAAVSSLGGAKIVVVKSTVLPGTTDSLQERFPQHRFLFSPEFLSEATADYDVANPVLNIVGYTNVSKSSAEEVMALFARAPFERVMPARAAELYKYLRNAFFASKVVFFNQIYDLAERLGVDYEALRACAVADPWVAPGGMHTVVWHKGYRGYGGKCLPKDVKALIRFAQEHGVDLEFLRTVEAVNERLRAIPPR